jgi:pyruvate dehydrogenase E2 component (dihydrolipoamide acetyltransferase)
MIELKVPDIGDFKDVEVIEVLVKPGDTVAVDQSLLTIESDKASMEIPSSAAGVIKELKVKVGDKINQGTLIAIAEGEEGAAAPAPAKSPAVPSEETAAPAATAEGKVAPPPVVTPSPVASASAASSSSSPAAAGGADVDVAVPDIGDFKDVEVIEILVAVGDTIAVDQSVITIESDKASMEIPSSKAGVVKELKVKVGDKISQGSPLVVLAGEAGAAPAPASTAAPSASAAPAASPPTAAPASPAPASPAPATPAASAATTDQAIPHASPSVRKFARELGVDLNLVKGSGGKGRIVQEDVQAFVKAALAGGGAKVAVAVTATGSGFGAGWPAWPSLDFAKFGTTETVALSRIKKISGPNLARNWASIPHVTQFDEADITELEDFRKSTNDAFAKKKDASKVTMLAFVMKACVAALKEFPAVNSSLDADGSNLILKKYYHLGFAADTPNGLVVPVLRDVDRKGIAEIARETAELAAQARAGKLGPTAMQGASFTISSLGGVGGTFFTPIINAPEVAILGLSKSDFKPKWDGKAFQPRLMLPLSLSYDHRVIDGAQAARFTTYLADVLADLRRVLL